MLLIGVYCLVALDYKVSLKSMLPAFGVGNAYIAAVAGLNQLIGTNYIMISELPDQLYEIYPFLEYLSPIFWLELVGALAMLLSFLPAFFHNRNHGGSEAKLLKHEQYIRLLQELSIEQPKAIKRAPKGMPYSKKRG